MRMLLRGAVIVPISILVLLSFLIALAIAGAPRPLGRANTLASSRKDGTWTR
jgi:hypothetical protein